MDSYFLVVPPGLEELARLELGSFGIIGKSTIGGVEFSGPVSNLYSANYYSRVGVKVLARIGMPFYARSDNELGQKAMNLPWERWIGKGYVVTFHVTCKRSKLIHTGMVENIIRSAIQKKVTIASEADPSKPNASVVVRIYEDLVTISIDSSGEPLYKRGYRQEVTRSPMRENLAAALIMCSGWNSSQPLIDPFCGSGTIPIEAAMIASRIPPGRDREFAFTTWPGYDVVTFNNVRDSRLPSPRPVEISGYDRDDGAIEISKRNAARAGLSDQIIFKSQSISYLQESTPNGVIVTNPPYGERISAGMDLRNLYAQLGNVMKQALSTWSVTLITNDKMVAGHSGLKFRNILTTDNGGIRTDFITTAKATGELWKE